jgi:hypothetical protein
MVATVLVALASLLGALLFRRVRCCVGMIQVWCASLLAVCLLSNKSAVGLGALISRRRSPANRHPLLRCRASWGARSWANS